MNAPPPSTLTLAERERMVRAALADVAGKLAETRARIERLRSKEGR